MDYTVENRVNKKLAQMKRDGVKFISSTVAPADSYLEGNYMNIESPLKAIEYFKEKNSEMYVSIQPKWMGSRGTMYMFRSSIEDSYIITRGGFRINYKSDKFKDSDKVIAHWWKEVFSDKSLYFSGVEEIILDGEIMPWAAIGSGLIERSFHGYSKAIGNELSFLKDNGYEEVISSFTTNTQYTEWNAVDDETEKKKSPYHETNKLYTEFFKEYNLDEDDECLDAFNNQLEFYDVKTKPYFVAFDILRIKYTDGSTLVDTGWLENVISKFNILKAVWPKAAIEHMNMLNSNFHTAFDNPIKNATQVFSLPIKVSSPYIVDMLQMLLDNSCDIGVEGFMIKPVLPAETDAVHCMKLRNPEYLRLIYGHDYDITNEKLLKLVKSKKTGKKRRLSHDEYKLGLELLKLEPTDENYDAEFDRISKKILFDIEEESSLDHRL